MKFPLIALLVLLLPYAAWPDGSDMTAAIGDRERVALSPSRELLEKGRSVASTACASCHGLDGASTGPGIPHLAGQRTVYLHRVLQSYQDRRRRSDVMNHATDFLNADALLAVSAYYASLPPVRPDPSAEREPFLSMPSAADPFVDIRDDMKKCVRCHGEDGNSTASGMPSLTAQDTEYFVHSMKAYRDGGRNHRMMQRLAENLDDATLTAMGTFYAVQEPQRTEVAGDGDAAAGRAATADCAACHGEDGNAASPEMPSLAGMDARYFIKAMQAYRDGSRSHQPMFDAVESIDDGQFADLAAFYAWQVPVRRNVRMPLSTGEWISRCERCHGIEGNSSDPRFPMLAGQEQSYLARALRAYTGTTRENSVMHAMSEPLSEADIDQIVEYYATREPKSVMYMQLPCEN